jgi:hypothetical protein
LVVDGNIRDNWSLFALTGLYLLLPALQKEHVKADMVAGVERSSSLYEQRPHKEQLMP